MKTTKKDYELFKKECLYWIKRFELNNSRIYFEYKDLGENIGANCSPSTNGNMTLALALEIHPFHRTQNEEIKYLAKHEVLHSLLGVLSELAHSRYVGQDELLDAEERLVRKLVNIIK